jgi:hypothetical protein
MKLQLKLSGETGAVKQLLLTSATGGALIYLRQSDKLFTDSVGGGNLPFQGTSHFRLFGEVS